MDLQEKIERYLNEKSKIKALEDDADVKEFVKKAKKQLKEFGDLEFPGAKMIKKGSGASNDSGVYEYKGNKFKVEATPEKGAFEYNFTVEKI